MATYYADLSLSTDILAGDGTLTMSVRDLFNSRKRESEIFADAFYSISESRFRQRFIRMAFSYRFKQKKRSQGDGNGNGGNLEDEVMQ